MFTRESKSVHILYVHACMHAHWSLTMASIKPIPDSQTCLYAPGPKAAGGGREVADSPLQRESTVYKEYND